ncbi:unnamed protein product [Diabrotica balteata]|uniref:Uncharacterized protein n=1 Tax=Diabrotica balteata TaxID=107213 RepID=A0A9N9T308_DIABA|nr:unnamed protein product [Diabrotica balteata]
MIGCGNKTRTQKEVCEMFNDKYPGKQVSQSTVSTIEKKFRYSGHVKNIEKPD